ncbi:MAG: TraR/DksA family transcriptional regulator [Chloroflexota bacterium]
MSDDIDLAQQHEEMHRAHAIAAALERPRRAGRPLCLECEEPISPDRQAIGADLCPECQGFADQRHFMTTGRRAA